MSESTTAARRRSAPSNSLLLARLVLVTTLGAAVAVLVAHYGFGHAWLPVLGPGIPSAVVTMTILYRGYRH